MTIPVQELDRRHVIPMQRHFAALGADDRRLRFGAALAPAALDAYVDSIDFGADTVFGVLADDLSLTGVAHLPCRDEIAELGLSVLPHYRGQGIGSALFRRAVMHARNRGIGELFMHCLAENSVVMSIARRAGMKLVIDHAEADAHLELAPATPTTLGQEIAARQIALIDSTLKAQVAHARRLAVIYSRSMAG